MKLETKLKAYSLPAKAIDNCNLLVKCSKPGHSKYPAYIKSVNCSPPCFFFHKKQEKKIEILVINIAKYFNKQAYFFQAPKNVLIIKMLIVNVKTKKKKRSCA